MSCRVPLSGFQEFKAIPERIEHVESVETIERLVLYRSKPRVGTTSSYLSQPADQKSGMRLSGGAKVWIDAKVNPKRTAAKPDTTSRNEVCRLGFLRQSENAAVEGSSDILLTRRHG